MLNNDKEKYIAEFNPIGDDIWLPKIDSLILEAMNSRNEMITIGHDWFSYCSYEIGFFYLDKDGKMRELQSNENVTILNEDEDYFFELGSDDHKGLIALNIPSDMDFFHMANTRQSNGTMLLEVRFLEDISMAFKQRVLSSTDEYACDVVFKADNIQQLSVLEYSHIRDTKTTTML